MFSALRIRDFRILWFGTLLSFVAFFMAMIVQSVVAFEIAGDNSAVGGVVFAQGLGMAVFGPVGGAYSDRWPKRTVVAWGQITAALVFLTIAILIHTGAITIFLLALGSFLLGVTLAFLGPARQGLVVDLVPPEKRGNAMAINVTANTGSRVFGPLVAGVLLSWELSGAMGAYLVMAVFYAISAASLVFLPPSQVRSTAKDRHVFADIADGLAYVWGHRRLRILVLFFALVIFTGFPHVTVLPGLVENVFQRTAAEVSSLFLASAAGALAASVWVVRFGDSSRAHVVYATMAALFGVSLLGLGWAADYTWALVAMFGVGVGSGGFQSLNAAVIARETEVNYIGRVMSLALLAFAGFGVMALPYGILADRIGERGALFTMGAAVSVFTVYFSVQLVRIGAIKVVRNR